MTGRNIKQEEINNRTYAKIINDEEITQPAYILGFFNFLAQKSANTRRTYVYDLIKLYKYLVNTKGYPKPLSKEDFIHLFTEVLNLDLLQDFLNMNNASPATYNSRKSSICKFFDYLIAEGQAMINLCDRLDHAKIYRDAKEPLTDSQLDKLLYNAYNPEDIATLSYRKREKYRELPGMYPLMIEIAFATGMRVSSLLEINLEDIDFNNNVIHTIVKGNKPFDCYISKDLTQAIREWIKTRAQIMGNKRYEHNFLWIMPKTFKPMTSYHFDEILEELSCDIGYKVAAHDLRRKAGYEFHKSCGGDLRQTQEFLGHSSPNTTALYTFVGKDQKRNMADKMGKMLQKSRRHMHNK